jgi:hypothetical protein
MMKAKQRELQRQIAKTLLQNDEPQRVAVVAYKWDRLDLSTDVLTAQALKESALEVHKRSPNTTYLSQLESFIVLINDVAATQEAAKARTAKQLQEAAKSKAKKPPLKSSKHPALPAASVKTKKPPRPTSIPKARLLPSGAIIIR